MKLLDIILWLQSDDLIKALQELEHSASQDAEVRERIANLPTEVQDASGLDKLEGKGKAVVKIQQQNT